MTLHILIRTSDKRQEGLVRQLVASAYDKAGLAKKGHDYKGVPLLVDVIDTYTPQPFYYAYPDVPKSQEFEGWEGLYHALSVGLLVTNDKEAQLRLFQEGLEQGMAKISSWWPEEKKGLDGLLERFGCLLAQTTILIVGLALIISMVVATWNLLYAGPIGVAFVILSLAILFWPRRRPCEHGSQCRCSRG